MTLRQTYNLSKASLKLDVVTMSRIRIQMLDWFGALGGTESGFVGTLITASVAQAAMASESDWVGEVRISMRGTARQDYCMIFHVLISTGPLD